MSNKLPQYVKDSIYRSVVADIPKVNQEELKSKIQAALVKAMSITCRNLYKKNPEALRKAYVTHAYGVSHAVYLVCGDADDKAVLEKFANEHTSRQKILSDLKSAINACTTRKSFVDRLPELTGYLPNEGSTCTTLPAIANVVVGLVKLGFDPKVTRA